MFINLLLYYVLLITIILDDFLHYCMIVSYLFFILDQPHNPMVNSGAIMSASILLQLVKPEMNMAQKYDYVFEFFKKMAGGEYLGFNNSVFLSERDSADRNFALAYFLRENLCFPPGDVNIPNILDFYFQVQEDPMILRPPSMLFT